MVQPTFLICSERSGSNLIRAMLDAHSQVFAPIPLNLGRDIWYRLHRYGDLRRDANWAVLVGDVVRRFTPSASVLRYTLSETELFEEVEERSMAALYRYVYTKGMRAAGKSMLFLKENYVGQHLWIYRDAFPDARFVYQVRDPRDYLLSCRRVGRIDPLYRSDATSVGIWREDQAAGLNALFGLGPDRVFCQRYEDLVRKPARVLEALCAFLDIPFERSMIDYHKRRASRAAAGERPTFWRNLSRPVISDNVEKYRKQLGGLAIGMVEQRVGPLMRQLGYAPATNPPGRTRRLAIRAYEVYRKAAAIAGPLPRLRRGTPRPVRRRRGGALAGYGEVNRVRYPYRKRAGALTSAAGARRPSNSVPASFAP